MTKLLNCVTVQLGLTSACLSNVDIQFVCCHDIPGCAIVYRSTRVSAILGRQCFVVLLAVEGLDFSLKMTQCYVKSSQVILFILS